MEKDNIGVVKQIYEAFDRGDVSLIVSLQTEDTVWDHSGPEGNPLNQVYKGHDGVREFFRILGELQEPVEFDPKEYFASGDRVVALGSFRFRVHSTGKEWASDWAMAYTLRDGLVAHWRPIFDLTAEAAALQP